MYNLVAFAPHFWLGILKAVRFTNLLMLAFTQYLAGCCLTTNGNNWLAMLLNPIQLRLVGATVFIAAAGYLINDYYDVKIDYINKPDKVIVGKELNRREVIFTHSFLNFAGILLAFTISWPVGLTCLMAAVLLWLYSNKLKRLPLVGNLMVAFLTWLAIALVGYQFKGNQFLILTYAGFAALSTLIREVIKDIEDIPGDRRFGCKTLPILLGIAKTKLVLLPLILLLMVVLLSMGQYVEAEELQSVFYCLILLVLFAMARLFKADSQKHFSWLSSYWKVIMLAGVLSMLLFLT